MNSIKNYLPKKIRNVKMIQGRIPEEILEKVKVIMKQQGLSWSDILSACLSRVIDEDKEWKGHIR